MQVPREPNTPLMKEYTLNHNIKALKLEVHSLIISPKPLTIKAPIIEGILLNEGVLGSLGSEGGPKLVVVGARTCSPSNLLF